MITSRRQVAFLIIILSVYTDIMYAIDKDVSYVAFVLRIEWITDLDIIMDYEHLNIEMVRLL